MTAARADGARRRATRALACAMLLALAWNAAAAAQPGWRQGMRRWQQRPAEQRQDILRAQRRYNRLPPEQRQRLMDEYRRQDQR